MADVQLVALSKRYGDTLAVDRFDLEVADRTFVTLLGPSGSGKTTVLRMIAGYTAPSSGRVVVGGREVQHLPPERRDIGMVFQSYALFPHLTVFRNVAFGLERRRVGRREVGERVENALALVRLTGLEHRYPRELSGGQQQRVALARALVIRPGVLLLDEPLSSLDAQLRGMVQLEIRRLQQQLGITTILVTHDQEEALTMSDRIAVIHEGRLEQVATPEELYRRPATRFAAEFIGRMNLLRARRAAGDASGTTYVLSTGERLAGPAGPIEATLCVRPEAIATGPPPSGLHANVLRGVLAHRVFLGEIEELGIQLEDRTVVIVRRLAAGGPEVLPGRPVAIWWPADRTGLVP